MNLPFRAIWLKLGILACFFSLQINGNCQDFARIEQLKKQVASGGTREKIMLLNQLAFEFRNSYPDSTIVYAKQSLGLGQAAGVESFISESFNFMGLAYAYKGKPREALQQYTMAFEKAKATNDSLQLGFTFNNLGRLFFDAADFTRAYSNFASSRIIFEALRNPEGLSYVYRSLADLFQSQHDYENAMLMSQKALGLRRQLNDHRGVISALSQLGKTYQLTKDYTQAENAFREAETIASDAEDEASLAEIKLGLAELYFANGSYTKAKTEGFRADAMIQKMASPLLLSRSNLVLGQIFLKEKNYAEAFPYLQKAVQQAETYRQLQVLTEAQFYLAKWYGLQGINDKANEYENKYRALNDSLKNSELASLAEKFNFQLEIEKGTRENDLLKAKEAESEALIKFQRTINYGAVAFVLLVSFFSYLLWHSGQMRKKINSKLGLQNQQLNELNQEKDSLMGIVAHDLKTPLSNIRSITGLVPNLGNMSQQQKQFITLIQSSANEGLTLINELLDAHTLETVRTPNLKLIDSSPFLSQRIESFHTAASTKSIELVVNHTTSTPLQTDPDWLGRCLDNLLSNALKFSPKNSTVTVSSGVTETVFWISVKDQGPGFTREDKTKMFQKFKRLSARPTAGESSNGLGLNIVKTLIERMHGSINLISEAGQGSEFIIRLGLPPAASSLTSPPTNHLQ